MKYLIGIVEDNATQLINKADLSLLGLDINYNSLSTQPLTNEIFLLFNTFLDPILLYNLFVIIVFALNILFYFRFINIIIKDKVINIFVAVLFGIAPGILYQSYSHPNLFPVFLLIFGLERIIKMQTKKQALLLGIYMSIVGLASNYFVYFLLIVLSFYKLYEVLVYKIFKVQFKFKPLIMGYAITVLSFLIFSAVFFLPYLLNNYYNSKKASQISEITINDDQGPIVINGSNWKIIDNDYKEDSITIPRYNRPLEDFFTFTSRPWYFFLPSPENPFFGNFTVKAVDYLQNDWGYWLTPDYFPREHTASYLGWTNFILSLIGLYFIFKKIKNKKAEYFYWQAVSLGLTALTLVFFMMPPYLTISLHKIYMPSYLLYVVFPMFRSLVRLGIIVLAIELVFTGFGYIYIKEKLNITKISLYKYLFFLPFFALSIAEFYIPPVITDVSTPPKVFSYLSENTPKGSSFAIYPSSDSSKTIFWLKESKRRFVNPQYVNYPEIGFFWDKFTAVLPSCKGILEGKNLGVDYIIYTEPKDPNIKDVIKKVYFDNSDLLKKVKYFDDTKSTLYEIIDDMDYNKEQHKCINSVGFSDKD